MNPLTKVKLINELNEKEARLGIKDSVSWHAEYKDSAWIFIGGFPYELTEGDIICVFSQYGEIANINLVRDKKTGKSKGFCFLCYEDQRSTILAVDNFNGIKIKGRTLRVDHVSNYRPPKDSEDIDEVTRHLREEGCAPKVPSSSDSESQDEHLVPLKKPKKDKKEKKKKKKEKKEKRKELKEERQPGSPFTPALRVKKEKEDMGYDKYVLKGAQESRDGRRERRSSRERAEDQHRDHRRGERDTERERDREDERRTGRSREESRGRDEQQRPRESRERGRENDIERERDRVKDRPREREREGERHYRERRRDRDAEYRRS